MYFSVKAEAMRFVNELGMGKKAKPRVPASPGKERGDGRWVEDGPWERRGGRAQRQEVFAQERKRGAQERPQGPREAAVAPLAPRQ